MSDQSPLSPACQVAAGIGLTCNTCAAGKALFSQESGIRQGYAAGEGGTELRDLASPTHTKSAFKKPSLAASALSLPAMRLASNEVTAL